MRKGKRCDCFMDEEAFFEEFPLVWLLTSHNSHLSPSELGERQDMSLEK
jgi:hypothetical protein